LPTLSDDEVQDSYWPSPAEVITPGLVKHIKGLRYAEVCAGNGKLIRHLQPYAKCVWASDVYSRHGKVVERCALSLTAAEMRTRLVITNPPFSSKFLYRFLDHCIEECLTTWLFLPMDFGLRVTSAFVMPFCERIVAIGPVRFIEDSPSKGETNFAWFKFVPRKTRTIFEAIPPRFNSSKVPDRLKQKVL
jgi:hypothetical protein